MQIKEIKGYKEVIKKVKELKFMGYFVRPNVTWLDLKIMAENQISIPKEKADELEKIFDKVLNSSNKFIDHLKQGGNARGDV